MVDEPEPARIRWARWLALAGLVLLVLGGVHLGLRPWLLEVWSGHYGDWRDPILLERIRAQMPFLFTCAAIALGAALLLRLCPDRPVAYRNWKLLLALTLALGALLSCQDWGRWGLCCWDGYCDRADLWRGLIRDPSAVRLEALRIGIVGSYVGASALPPLLIGLVAATGIKVYAAFMLVNAASWCGVAYGVVRIARRHLGCDEHQVLFCLLLVFGHFSSARSLLFLQTDPIPLMFAVWAVALNMDLIDRPRAPVLWIGLFLVVMGGVLSKLTFFPMLCLPVLCPLLMPGPRRERLRRALTGGANVLVQLLAFGIFLWVTGLYQALSIELWGVGEFRDTNGDDELYRLLITFMTTVQFVPLTLYFSWRKKELTPKHWLLVAVALLFPAALIAVRGTYWSRYLLPMIPFMALFTACPLLRWIGNRAHGLILAATGVLVNAAYMFWGLYF